jgi:heme exporter protein B
MTYWLNGAWSVLAKDLRLEFRTRYAVNMLIMFVVSSLLVVSLGVGSGPVTPKMLSGLLWIVIFFSAAVGLGRAFVAEEEGGTVLLLRLNVRGSMVYAGKLAFNYLMLLGVDLLATLGFRILLNMSIQESVLLGVVLAVGSLGLAGATTLLSAIIARTSNRGPLLPVILFPILFPLLMTIVPAARTALEGGGGWEEAVGSLKVMIAFAGVVITGAVLLFDYVWED